METIENKEQTSFRKECDNCRKLFDAEHQATKFCSEPCKRARKKRKKSRQKSNKSYSRKHNVTRALETASRRLARKLATTIYDCRCYMSGESFIDWKFLQIHHLDGNPFNNNPKNLIPLCPTEHAKLHKMISTKFGKDVDYMFGVTYENTKENPIVQRELDHKVVSSVVEFQLQQFKYTYRDLVEFNTED